MSRQALQTARKNAERDARGTDRRAARLRAVQALYQIDVLCAAPDRVVAEFEQHRLGGGPPTERPFFSALVRDASARQAEIDELIGGALPANWPITRLELVLLAILRCGVGELSSPHEVPPKVTISEYVDIAHGFLDAKGAAMVNAVLDRLARTLRGGELDAQADPTR